VDAAVDEVVDNRPAPGTTGRHLWAKLWILDELKNTPENLLCPGVIPE
jgi:hypothetical protein